jgi:CO/xanthine dehydrogenase Mo-binding subunit
VPGTGDLTPDNAPRWPRARKQRVAVAKPLLQDKLVYYNGQHIAVVVADTLERGQAAADRVSIAGQAQIHMQDALGAAY